jgi:hypothetical protein
VAPQICLCCQVRALVIRLHCVCGITSNHLIMRMIGLLNVLVSPALHVESHVQSVCTYTAGGSTRRTSCACTTSTSR